MNCSITELPNICVVKAGSLGSLQGHLDISPSGHLSWLSVLISMWWPGIVVAHWSW